MSAADHVAVTAPEVPASPMLEATVDMRASKQQRLAGLVIVLAVAFLPSVLTSVLRASGVHYTYPDNLIAYSYFSGLVREVTSLALLAYVLRQNRQTLADLGFGFRWRDLPYGFLLWAGAVAAHSLFYPTILSICQACGWQRAEAYVPALKLGLSPLGICLDTINPVFEEMIVRAFLMTETIALTGSTTFAVLLSFLVQTSYHLYQGVPYALALGVVFLIFSLYYARTRHILPVILAHFLMDIAAHLTYVARVAHGTH